VIDVRLSLSGPGRLWAALIKGTNERLKNVAGPIAPDVSLSATFRITSPVATGAGFLIGKVEWKDPDGRIRSDTATERVRNVSLIKINEVRLGVSCGATDQYIELYNASTRAVDLSRWMLVSRQSQWAPMKLATIPEGTSLMAHGFYLLWQSNSGLAAPASAVESTVYVRSAEGFKTGQKIEVDGETRTIAGVGSEAAPMTMLFAPVSTGPWLTIPAGATNLPVVSAEGFAPGQKIGIDIGGNYETATVTAVGNAATQTTLSAAAFAGATNIKLAADANVSAGDMLTISTGGRKEIVKVASVGSPGANGSGIEVATPLRLDHESGVDVSDVAPGLAFRRPLASRT
jgi:non-reducing end alpha-L-arabinofuranosidase